MHNTSVITVCPFYWLYYQQGIYIHPGINGYGWISTNTQLYSNAYLNHIEYNMYDLFVPMKGKLSCITLDVYDCTDLANPLDNYCILVINSFDSYYHFANNGLNIIIYKNRDYIPVTFIEFRLQIIKGRRTIKQPNLFTHKTWQNKYMHVTRDTKITVYLLSTALVLSGIHK